jgi:hypothetical protein
VKQTRKTWWLGAAVLGLLGLVGKAQALGVQSSTATLVIEVTVTGSLSVNINAANSSTQTVVFTGTPNELLVSPSTVAVQNNSGILSEHWKVNSFPSSDATTPGLNPWALATTTSAVPADSFAIQAVFGSSNTAAGGCPAAGSTDWNQPYAAPLGNGVGAAITYTNGATNLADTALTTGGSPLPDVPATGVMFAAGQRALCWRVVSPASVTTADDQTLSIMVTAF